MTFGNIKPVEYRNFTALETSTMFEKTHVLCKKATLITIQRKIEKFYTVEQYTQEDQNTKRRFKLISNSAFFDTLLTKIILMGCPDSVLPEPLLKPT